MKLINRYERVLKDLDVLTRYVSEASLTHDKLDDKRNAQNVIYNIIAARRNLRLRYFDFEDAISSLTICPECGALSCDCHCEK